MLTVLHSASSGSCVDLKVDSFVSELTVYNHPLLFLLKFVFNSFSVKVDKSRSGGVFEEFVFP